VCLKAVARGLVRGLDAVVRRCQGIHEFSHHPDCVLRLALVRNRRDLTLPGAIGLREGDLVGDLHLWNERIPPMPPEGPTLSWAVGLRRRLGRSLEELAAAVECNARYRDIRAFRAVGTFAVKGEGETPVPLAVAALAERLGFEMVRDHAGDAVGRSSPWTGLATAVENLYNLALVWAYNPPSLKTRTLPRLRRVAFWASREGLIERYGGRSGRR